MERGIRAMARGGAAVVAADDLNAAYLNPAALIRSTGWTVNLEAAVVDGRVEFLRFPDPAGAPGCCRNASSHIWYLNPSGGVAYSGADGRWVAAFSVYGPFGNAVEFGAASDARYIIFDQANGLVYAQLSGAYRLPGGLTLGLGLQSRQFRMYQQLMGSTYPGFVGAPEDPQFDTRIDVRVDDWFSPGAVIGLLWEPTPWLALGGSYQTRFNVSGTGTLRSTIPSHYLFAETEQEGERIRLETVLPEIIRLGVQLRGAAAWDLELALVWERWSEHDSIKAIPEEPIRFTNVPGLGSYQVTAITVPDQGQDSWSFRLGGEYRPHPAWRVRVGGAFETAVLAPPDTTPGAYDTEKVQVGLGLTYRLAGWELDFGYSHLFFADREVRDSVRRQVNPLYPGDDPTAGPTVVGNGQYSAGMDAVALALLKRW